MFDEDLAFELINHLKITGRLNATRRALKIPTNQFEELILRHLKDIIFHLPAAFFMKYLNWPTKDIKELCLRYDLDYIEFCKAARAHDINFGKFPRTTEQKERFKKDCLDPLLTIEEIANKYGVDVQQVRIHTANNKVRRRNIVYDNTISYKSYAEFCRMNKIDYLWFWIQHKKGKFQDVRIVKPKIDEAQWKDISLDTLVFNYRIKGILINMPAEIYKQINNRYNGVKDIFKEKYSQHIADGLNEVQITDLYNNIITPIDIRLAKFNIWHYSEHHKVLEHCNTITSISKMRHYLGWTENYIFQLIVESKLITKYYKGEYEEPSIANIKRILTMFSNKQTVFKIHKALNINKRTVIETISKYAEFFYRRYKRLLHGFKCHHTIEYIAKTCDYSESKVKIFSKLLEDKIKKIRQKPMSKLIEYILAGYDLDDIRSKFEQEGLKPYKNLVMTSNTYMKLYIRCCYPNVKILGRYDYNNKNHQERVERIKRDYYNPDIPVHQICARHNTCSNQIAKYIKDLNWMSRHSEEFREYAAKIRTSKRNKIIRERGLDLRHTIFAKEANNYDSAILTEYAHNISSGYDKILIEEEMEVSDLTQLLQEFESGNEDQVNIDLDLDDFSF